MSTRLFALLFPAVIGTCLAQIDSSRTNNPSDSTFTSVGHDGLTALKAMGYVVTAPARWNANDWFCAGGVVALTTASVLLDDEASDLMRRNQSSFNNSVSDVAVVYGNGFVAAGFPVAMYLSGLVLKDDWVRETAVLMGGTVLLASAVTTVGKIAVGRARPYADLGNHEFKPFKNRPEYRAFPSGHATTAFAISAVLAARIKNPWASVGLYGAATLTCVSRIYSRDHWLSDVVFAAAYSTAVAHSIVNWFENENGRQEASHGFNILPTANGVGVVWRF